MGDGASEGEDDGPGVPVGPARAVDPRAALVSMDAVATILGVSKATVERMHAGGEIPVPIRLRGTILRWEVDELREWWGRRKPDGTLTNRAEWNAVRKAKAGWN